MPNEVRTTELAWMNETIKLATDNVHRGGGPFAALIIQNGQTVAVGTNLVTVNHDPTAHAEVTAIRNACRELETFLLSGCVLVTSCEPCPMCLASALWSRVDEVLFGADRHDAARAGFDDREFHDLFRYSETAWPTAARRVEPDDRHAPFDAWRNKSDRIDY